MSTIGHQQQKNILSSALKRDNLPHAFIFAGRERIGKKSVALEFVQNIFCQNKNLESEACGKCNTCRAIQQLSFPDLSVVTPEERGKEIKIEQIEQLINKLSLKSYNNYYKIGIIDDAHLMNSIAQNALLKTLEEPKGRAILILITAFPERLLSTIRSRAQVLKFFAVPKEEIERYLISLGANTKEAQEITFLSSGEIGRAIDFYKDPSKMKVFQNYLKEIERLCWADYAERFQCVKRISDEVENLEGFLQIMEIWERFFRREMLYKIFGDVKRLPKYSAEDLLTIIKNLERTRYLIITTNINKKTALENFLFNL